MRSHHRATHLLIKLLGLFVPTIPGKLDGLPIDNSHRTKTRPHRPRRQHIERALDIGRHHRTSGLCHNHTNSWFGRFQCVRPWLRPPSGKIATGFPPLMRLIALPNASRSNRPTRRGIHPNHWQIALRTGTGNRSLRPRYHTRRRIPQPRRGISK